VGVGETDEMIRGDEGEAAAVTCEKQRVCGLLM